MAILQAVYDQPPEKSLRFSMVLILLINVFGSTIQPATGVNRSKWPAHPGGPGEGLL